MKQNDNTEKFDLQSNLTHTAPDHHLSFDIFFAMANLDTLVKTIVVLSILYAPQNDREFQASENWL